MYKIENSVKYFQMFLEEEKVLYENALTELGLKSGFQNNEISQKLDIIYESYTKRNSRNIAKLEK